MLLLAGADQDIFMCFKLSIESIETVGAVIWFGAAEATIYAIGDQGPHPIVVYALTAN